MPVAAGINYFLHDGGKSSRPPLVLIHGAGGDRLSWPSEIRLLTKTRVFTLDLPGHGRSGGPGRQTVADYSRSVVGFMDEAGFSRGVFAGHGLGGAVVLALAAEHPDRVAGIVLISTGSRLPVPASILENAANPATFLPAVQGFLELMQVFKDAPGVKDQVGKQLSSLRPPLFLGDLRASDQFDLTSRLGGIRAPALVICGADDKLTPRRLSEDLAGQIPGAALQVIDCAGHLVMLEQPQRVARLMSVFLATVPKLV